MISRVADHCFWMGRHLDRAESTSRLLQVTRALAFDAELPALECWRPVVIVSGQYPDFVARFDHEAAGNGEVVQRYMTWALENPVSIRTSIRAAREGARSIREVLSLDIWQATNELYLWFASEEASQEYLQDRDELYKHVRRSTQLNLGLVRSTMLHDTPMDFLWLGVLLERVGQTARILDMHHHMLDGAGAQHQIVDTALWLSLLRSCSGFDAFMRLHRGRVSRSEVVSFLFFETKFPRSLRYCVQSALKVMRDIWGDEESTDAANAIEVLASLDAWLGEHARAPLPRSIHDLLTHVIDEIARVCGAVQQNIFGERAAPRRRFRLSNRLEKSTVVWLIWLYRYSNINHMKKTLHIDEHLLQEARLACRAETDTETVRLGLEALVRHAAYERLRSLRGTEPSAKEVPRRRERPSRRKVA